MSVHRSQKRMITDGDDCARNHDCLQSRTFAKSPTRYFRDGLRDLDRYQFRAPVKSAMPLLTANYAASSPFEVSMVLCTVSLRMGAECPLYVSEWTVESSSSQLLRETLFAIELPGLRLRSEKVIVKISLLSSQRGWLSLSFLDFMASWQVDHEIYAIPLAPFCIRQMCVILICFCSWRLSIWYSLQSQNLCSELMRTLWDCCCARGLLDLGCI